MLYLDAKKVFKTGSRFEGRVDTVGADGCCSSVQDNRTNTSSWAQSGNTT